MRSYNILQHYDHSDLLGVWVSQGEAPPQSRYESPEAQADGAITVIGDKMPDVSWNDHLDAVADRLSQPPNWWVGDVVVLEDDVPDVDEVWREAKAEDRRLRSRL